MEKQELRVEVRKRRGRVLDPILKNHLTRSPSGFGYKVNNYTKKDIRLARVTGEVQRFPAEKTNTVELQGTIVITDNVHFKSLWELKSYVKETKSSLNYESLSNRTLMKSKIDYLEDLIPSEERKIHNRSNMVAPSNFDGTEIDISIHYLFSFEDGECTQNTMLEDLDLYVGPIGSNRLIHPNCKLVLQTERLIEESAQRNITHYSITMIDNSGKIAPRFCRVGSEIIEVIPHRDLDRKDGLYQSILSIDEEGGRTLRKIDPICISEVGEHTNFHTNRDDVDTKLKDRIETEKLELERKMTLEKHGVAMTELQTKHDIALRQLQSEQEERTRKLEQEAAKYRMELENKEQTYRIEQQRLMRNDHFDERKAIRTDYTESSKFLYGLGGAFLTGVLGFLAYRAK